MIAAKKTWVVIPAFNEGERIVPVIKEAHHHAQGVVVVDDGSSDSTSDQAQGAGAIVLRHCINLGKGAALKTGCDFAIEQGAGRIVVIDADGQHDPADIPRILKALEGHDIVFSFRRLDTRMPFVLRLGNRVISSIVTILYHVRLRDTQCGFRAFSSEAYGQVRWDATDYSMESEMIARAGRNRLRYTEIPIATVYADKYKGTTVIDGVKIVADLLWWKVKR
ncbi:MAG: glycosyltransferase family 2 protein [archaeon]